MPPSRIVGLMFTVIAILAVLCLLTPEEGIHIDLRWPTMSEMLLLNNDTTRQEEPEEMAADTIAPAPVAEDNVLDTVKDTRFYMRAFYESLPEAKEHTIRVVHYGDSQLEEDRMTSNLRRDLQSRFGGGGVGIVPLHQTIPTLTMSQGTYINGVKQTTKQGPERFLVYGPKNMRRSDGLYGPMGQSALLDNSRVAGSENTEVRLLAYGKEGATERFFNRVRLIAQDGIQLSTNGQTITSDGLITLPDSTYSTQLRVAGKGLVYGISLETPTGVIVDNIPMRGCAGTVFLGMNKQLCQDYFQQTNTRLVIMQFGGNAVNASDASIRYYVEQMRKQVRYMRECAPDAAFLFIGPSDMLTRKGGQKITIPGVPLLDKLLLRMCQEEKIGYWSLYKAMGGSGSMLRWQQQQMAGADGIHFTHAGADKAGQMLADYIEQGRLLTENK